MKAATRLFPAILILVGFLLIRICLYRLPSLDMLHSTNIKPLVGVDDARAKEVAGLPSTSALNSERIQATSTVQDQNLATSVSSTVSDQIVVMATTDKDDTSWIKKLSKFVFWATWIIFFEER